MKKYTINQIIYNNSNDAFTIIDIKLINGLYKYTVKSLQTGYTTTLARSTVYSGKYKDNLKSHSKFNGIIGYINTAEHHKEYTLWYGMMQRCYNKNHEAYKYYGGRGITVSTRWHRFDYFVADIPLIRGYDENLFYKGKLYLDKDISGKKIYSIDACQFVDIGVNNIFTSKQSQIFKVHCPNGDIHIFNNKKQVADLFKLDLSSIVKCLNGKRTHHKHFKFEYIDANDYQKANSQVE